MGRSDNGLLKSSAYVVLYVGGCDGERRGKRRDSQATKEEGRARGSKDDSEKKYFHPRLGLCLGIAG